MEILKNLKLKYIVSAVLLIAGLLFYSAVTDKKVSSDADSASTCKECDDKKAATYLGAEGSEEKNGKGGSNYFFKIFSLLTSGTDDTAVDTLQGADPVKDKAINEINSLSQRVCNEENLPEDVWISPKLAEKDAEAHIKELEKLISYCRGLKTGEATSEEKKDYYKIKIRLLEERKELIKYSIETLDGQIEDMNEKKIADMEERKADNPITPEEEKTNAEIERETNRFYEESVANTNKLINQLDSAINNYKLKLSKL